MIFHILNAGENKKKNLFFKKGKKMQNNKSNEKSQTINKEIINPKCRLCHLDGLDHDGAPLKAYNGGLLIQHPYCARMYARNLRALSKVIFKIRGDRSGLVDIEATNRMFQSAKERKEEHKKGRNQRRKEHKEMLARMENARNAKAVKKFAEDRLMALSLKTRMLEANKREKPNIGELLKESQGAEDRRIDKDES